MKTLYEASNAIEAHMLVDLLKQEGLTAHIRGEHLQGAVGEMPAAGLVRLEIDESAFAQARALIDRWETAQPAENATRSVSKKSNGVFWMFAGIIVGFVSCCLHYFYDLVISYTHGSKTSQAYISPITGKKDTPLAVCISIRHS